MIPELFVHKVLNWVVYLRLNFFFHSGLWIVTKMLYEPPHEQCVDTLVQVEF